MVSTIAATREETPFGWSAGAGMPAYAHLARVPLDQLFLDVDAIIDAWTRGRPMVAELFGPDVALGGPTWQAISYGHANCLGVPLHFPHDSEVGHTPIYGSLDEGIAALKRPVHFQRQGMFPFYLDLWEKLKAAFPGQKITFHHKAEGPITTAWILRGHDFFYDLLDDPPKCAEYLGLVTESVITYSRLVRRVNGEPEISPAATGMVDDIAAMVPPDRWPTLVVPFIHRYYEGLTTGRRHAHIEDLVVAHLPFLDELALSMFDPSVSPKLTPRLLRDHCRTPFQWRLNCTHYPDRSPDNVAAWVYHAAADGASGVFTNVAQTLCNPEDAEKVKAFIRAGKEVKSLLDHGCRREELLELEAAAAQVSAKSA